MRKHAVRQRAVSKSWADPQPPMTAAESDKKAEITAVRLLARREHGTRELKRKLAAKGHGGESVDRVVEKLGAESLVSDERFVSTFISYHAGRGHGPVRIKAELRQRGVLDTEITAGLLAAPQEWAAIARGVRLRKFGGQLPRTASERAKQARFLQYRGFTTDQIRAAFQIGEGESEEQCDADPSSESVDQDWSD